MAVSIKALLATGLLIASILASVGGILAFIFLFVPDWNIYWLILAPVILAVYQMPAALLYKLYKNTRNKEAKPLEPPSDTSPETHEDK